MSDIYDTTHIQILTGLDAVRMRPGMYFGDINTGEALLNMIAEPISNALDQYAAGHATEVVVRSNDDTTWTVTDDGEGLPFDAPCLDTNRATVGLLNLHAGPSMSGHAPHIHLLGAHGAGMAAVNATTSALSATAWRGGQRWHQRFARGVTLTPAQAHPDPDGRGTHIALTPDPEIFTVVDPEAVRAPLRAALFRAAHLLPGVRITLNHERFHAPNGLADLIHVLHPLTALGRSIWSHTPPLTFQLDTPLCRAQLVLYGTAHDAQPTAWTTWVNGVPSPLHGSHLDGVRDALAPLDWRPEAGLLHVIASSPAYAGPTHDKLHAPPIRDALRDALSIALDPAMVPRR